MPQDIKLRITPTHIQWSGGESDDWTDLFAFDWLRNIGNRNSVPGSDGREVDLQKSSTHIQWRYIGDVNWNDLVALIDLKGDPGSSGGGTYTHTQGVPATTWNINHNLNYFPSVTIVDSTGRKVYGDVEYVNPNSITVIFRAAFSGKVYLG